MTEKFLMVSLEEEKTKKIAEAISNTTARKILDHLADHEEASESEIAQKLNLPLSTVHYNIKNLLATNLIESKEFRWSQRGKQIDIYTIAKKYIVIAPTKNPKLTSHLKTVLPTFLLSIAGAAAIHLTTKLQPATQKLTPLAADTATQAAQETARATAPTLAQETINVTITTPTISPALWFLIGAWIAILIFVLTTWRTNKP